MKRLLPVITLLCIFASPALAWNCSDPLASRVPVPAGTAGSFGNGDGQLFLGTGSEGVKGQLYECKVPTPDPTKTKGAPIYQNQTQSQTSSSNSSSTSNSNANSNSTSNAAGGNSTSTATGGSSTAQGGSSAVKNSGNSTLANSGNSSNTNTNSNSAQGGAGGSANSSASNNSTGNTSTYDSSTTVEASKIPVATALAVAPPATSPCVVGFGGGVQTMAFGGSISGGKIDKNCAILETARSFASMNARLAYCKTMLIDKYAKKAGITLEDCMRVPTVILTPTPIPTPVATPQPIVIQVPAAVLPPPQPVQPVVTTTGTLRDLGSFKVTRSYSTNLCPTVQVVLGSNGVQILDRAISLHGEVTLVGNVYTTAVATSYLRKHGVSKVVIRAADEQDNSVGVQVWIIQ